MKYKLALASAIVLALGVVTANVLAECQKHTATFINVQGESIGTAALKATPNGVLIQAELQNLPEGWHAFHIHETGTCTPPDFASAGGHYNPQGHAHGYKVEGGYHAGDLPNVYVNADGKLTLDVLASHVTLDDGPHGLLDENGSALVIHAKADDYVSQPAGDAGGRIACAVIQ